MELMGKVADEFAGVTDLFLEEIDKTTRLQRRSFDNKYIEELADMAGLHILQENKVINTISKNKELGLFQLFFTKQYLEVLNFWTNAEVVKCWGTKISYNKFIAYLGLEMAMSLVGYNTIPKYWQKGRLTGHDDFKKCMSRDNFSLI